MDDLILRAELQDRISSFKMPWDYVDAINSIASINTFINEAPTIDAVPVEWLREKMNLADDAGDLDSVDLFSWIIQTWRKEQEG